MGNAGPNEFLLRLAKDTGTDLPAEFSSEFGLTTREREVLSWLSKGKTNRDIAQILGAQPPHRRQASGADLRQARRREPHRGCRDRNQCDTARVVNCCRVPPREASRDP